MSEQRQRMGSPDSNIYPRPLRPSGLRTRERTPQSRPHVDQPGLPPPLVASSNLAPNSSSPATPTIVPLFESPVTADRANRRRGWVGGSSKRLKFPKLREKTSVSKEKEDKKMAPGPEVAPQGKSPRQLIIESRSHAVDGEVNFPAQARDPIYRASPSPTEKPLPSLPIATVKFKSPVRRSLIDCQERPLRRSVSPPDGGPAKEEEWPSMQPSNAGARPIFPHPQSSIKPSLGESFIEGMRGLHLDDKEKENMAPDTRDLYDGTEPPVSHGKTMPAFRGYEAGSASVTTVGRPLSSSQLPKPRESMLNSLARHTDGPAVRQTKTSTLRLRRSIGKRTWNSGEKKRDDHSQLASVHERAQSPTVPKTRHITPGGPIRTNSRGRLGVTARGSPYTVPSLLNRRPDTVKRNSDSEPASGHDSMHMMGDRHNPSVVHENNQGDSERNTTRQSPLPIPGRIANPETKLDNLAMISTHLAAPKLSADTIDDTDTGKSNAAQWSAPVGAGDVIRHDKSPGQAHTPGGELLDIKEVLSSPPPTDSESIVGSDDSGVTVHGYDAFGGFRVKHLGNGNGHMDRPVLRIADSASRILLGSATADNSLEAPDINPGIRHKGSAPNLRRAPEVKEEVRRSSAIFTRPLSLARSITDWSPAAFKKSENDESCHNLLASDNAVSKDAPAELSGTEVVFGTKPNLEPQTSMASVETPSRESSEYRRSPASAKGDWPGKDFADLNLCPESPTRRLRRGLPCAQTDGVAFKRPASPASIPSRPSTIVVRAPPSREIAPFLFQDPNEEKVKQNKLTTAGAAVHDAKPDTTFPPRSSSRKPKPPPIVVSPPVQVPSVNFFPRQASKAYGVQPETIQKPKNVKTFSQSVSPRTDSSKTLKVWGKPSHSPSSSSRKVISNIRGLFHKRSTESTSQTNSAGGRGSVRRKSGPENKTTTNPLLTHQDTERSEPGRMFHYPNRGTRNAIRNPFISPTTPFTATVQPDSYPEVNPSPVLSAQAPSTPVVPSLSNATTLTHALLDLAHVETDTQRKAHLIQLSKCMVEVVSAARDAEKAVEKAKMEASRAEVGLLKVQKEVATMEGLVNTVIMQHGEK